MTHFLQLTNLVGICSSAELPWCLASLGNECLLDGVALCMNRMSEFASVSDDLLHIYLQRMIRGVLPLCRCEWKWNIFPLSSCKKKELVMVVCSPLIKHTTTAKHIDLHNAIHPTGYRWNNLYNVLMDSSLDFLSRPVSRLYCIGFVCAFTCVACTCLDPIELEISFSDPGSNEQRLADSNCCTCTVWRQKQRQWALIWCESW